jgi:hypothetical protein
MPFAAFRHILARGFIGFYCFALHLCFDQGPLQYLAGDHVSLLWVGLSFTRPLCLRSNLVDSASSHTLVSKIKPCMSKYKSFTLKLRTAHYISYSLFDSPLLLG